MRLIHDRLGRLPIDARQADIESDVEAKALAVVARTVPELSLFSVRIGPTQSETRVV